MAGVRNRVEAEFLFFCDENQPISVHLTVTVDTRAD